MSRALLVIRSDIERAKASSWVAKAPIGTRVEFKSTKRSLPQNDRMWAMLTDIATQKDHCGRKYPPETWKAIFMHAWGREVQFVPSLDGDEIIPIAYHSSDLGKDEMSELIKFMLAWGETNGVVFHDQDSARRASIGERVA